MPDVTQILSAIDAGDANAAEQLLPLVYNELRRLAAAKLANERPGQTLQPTALVHEAWLRLVPDAKSQAAFENRRHFFAAAAEAMRRILVEKARRRRTAKHGGALSHREMAVDELPADQGPQLLELLAVHEALDRLAAKSPRKAELVKLRYFLGCTIPEAAGLLGIAPATAEEDWTYAKAWLRRQLQSGDD